MKPLVISESTTEPITIAQVVENLRETEGAPGTEAGGRISKLIKAARQACEQETGLSLVLKTIEVAQDSFSACPTELPGGPVRSIVSVTYVNSDGADTVLAADQYRLSRYESTAVFRTAYGVTLPTARYDSESVRIRYTAGYSTDDSPAQEVPEPILQAMHLYIAHYYANREAVAEDGLAELPLGVRHLLSTYRTGLGV